MSYLELARKTLESLPRTKAADVPNPSPGCEKSEKSEKSPLVFPAGLGEEVEPRGTLAEADALEAEGAAEFWYPPPEAPLYFQDVDGRPCGRSEASRWSWEGASSWFRVGSYPAP